MKTLKVNWWKEIPNFGDALTPILLERLAGIKAEFVPLEEAEFIGIGSYIEAIRPHYSGYLWGTGRMFEGNLINLSEAKILSLRGKLTKDSTISNCINLGDPALLCKYLEPKFNIKGVYKIGIIPHWNDKDLVLKYPGAKVIDVRGDIDTIIAEAKACFKIVSSSLHGIVLADALNKPRLWEDSPNNPGKGFKFKDYQSIYGSEITPGVWYQADQNIVDKVCKDSLEILKQI